MFGIDIKADDSTAKKVGKSAAVVGLAMLATVTFGLIIGYSGQKGANYANRHPVPGENAANDESMTTAQAGARGGRQRAA